ncbi:regulator of chromosome condensation 1/beta-lactamase-inhibitor protein II [Trametes elegans]|nr:regulator of chromosome condensation 1/beta-lactamase-inhibitor protein II [Trametes elegans]
MPPTLSLYSAGSNARGQLATGTVDDAPDFTPCVFSGAASGALPADVVEVEQIACGANHTLALLRNSDGTKCLSGCGDGARGQLGPSRVASVEEATLFRPLDITSSTCGGSLQEYAVRLIAAGWETSYVVLSCAGRDDVLLSMGADDYGNLGIGGGGRAPKVSSPNGQSEVHAVHLRDALPDLEAGAESALEILALSAGPHHTIARVRLVRPSGPAQTFCVGWGSARHGQLGPLLNASGRPYPFVPSPHIVPIPSPDNVSALALGNHHTAALLNNGRVSALGSNRKAQLSDLESLTDVERIGCTWNGTYALLRSGEVAAAGSNTHSQLGRGLTERERQGTLAPVQFPFPPRAGQIVQLACGSEHVLCVVEREEGRPESTREVWGWGWNEHGNLGTGNTEDVDVPVRIWPRGEKDADAGRAVRVWAGCGTSWILVER